MECWSRNHVDWKDLFSFSPAEINSPVPLRRKRQPRRASFLLNLILNRKIPSFLSDCRSSTTLLNVHARQWPDHHGPSYMLEEIRGRVLRSPYRTEPCCANFAKGKSHQGWQTHHVTATGPGETACTRCQNCVCWHGVAASTSFTSRTRSCPVVGVVLPFSWLKRSACIPHCQVQSRKHRLDITRT